MGAVESSVTFRLLGVTITAMTESALIASVREKAAAKSGAIIANVNAHAMNIACEKSWFREYLNSAALTYCDGLGVILAARSLGVKVSRIHRAALADFFDEMLEKLIDDGRRIFLLGARPEVMDSVLTKLTGRYGTDRISGHHGHFDHRGPENEAILRRIREFDPDILLVGFGMPLQEEWIGRNSKLLSRIVFLSVGACFDYIADSSARPPAWMNRNGLEWLGRLIKEPSRLWRRYLLGLPMLAYRVLRYGTNPVPDA